MLGRFPFTRQIEKKDCGPACLQILCRYWGKYIDMERIRTMTGAGRAGVSAYDLTTAAEQLGLRAKAYYLSFTELHNHMPLPCIVHWERTHFIVVYKITGKRVFVSDPGVGLISYKHKDFQAKWEGEDRKGVCIGVEPTASFKNVVSDKRQSNSLEALNYLRSYISPYKRQIAQIIVLMTAVTLLSAMVPIVTQAVIDTGIPQRDMDFIDIMLVAGICLGVGIALGNWLQQSISLFFSVRVKVSMMSDYISRMFKMPLDYFETRTIGSLMQRNYDFDRIEGIVHNSLFSVVLAGLYLLIFGTLLAIYSLKIFWIFMVGSVLYVSCVLLFWSVRKKMDIQYYTHLAQNYSHWVEFVTKVVDIKSFKYGRDERWKWEKTQTGLFKTRVKLLNVDQLQNVFTDLISSTRDAVLVFVSARAVIDGTMSVGMLAAVLYITGQLRAPLANAVNFVVSLQFFNISFGRVSDVYKTKPEREELGTNDNLVAFDSNLFVKKVCFKYSANAPMALNGITYSFPPGKITCIAGASGCGKSTLIKILAQLYTPSSGTVYIGNLQFNSFSVGTWRDNIGIVTQNSALISDTIANNIVFGRENDPERIRKSAEIASIRWEIESMPLGYETPIGEEGKGVSEGQKQRILLARAIYGDPKIILLDEITSLLDEKTEHSIMLSLRYNLPGKTIIMSAHRFGTVRMADNIVMMKSGYIAESGTHAELMLMHKEYYNIFKSQIEPDEREQQGDVG